jgi:hypothetical protein
MEGTGEIKINIENLPDKVNIDLKDTAKAFRLPCSKKFLSPVLLPRKEAGDLGLVYRNVSLSNTTKEKFL